MRARGLYVVSFAGISLLQSACLHAITSGGPDNEDASVAGDSGEEAGALDAAKDSTADAKGGAARDGGADATDAAVDGREPPDATGTDSGVDAEDATFVDSGVDAYDAAPQATDAAYDAPTDAAVDAYDAAAAPVDGGVDAADAAPDAAPDAVQDSAPDAAPDATPDASGDAGADASFCTTYFADNFDDGGATGFTIAPWGANTGNVAWSLIAADGGWRYQGTGGNTAGGGNSVAIPPANSPGADYTVEADISNEAAFNGGAWHGLLARYSDTSHFYVCSVSPTNAWLYVQGASPGYIGPQDAGATVSVPVGSSVHMALTVAGTMVRCVVGGVTLEGTETTLTGGGVGLVNAGGTTGFDNIVVSTCPPSTTPPGAPGTPTFSSVTATSMEVSWTASTASTTPASQLVYEVCQSTSPTGCSLFSANYTTAPGATSLAVTGLSPGTTYYFAVRAEDREGNDSLASAPGSQATAFNDAGVDGAVLDAGQDAAAGDSGSLPFDAGGWDGDLLCSDPSLSASLVAYYPLTTGFNDTSGHSLNATGANVVAVPGVPTLSGTAYEFNGSTSSIQVTGSYSLSSARTMCAWVNPTSNSGQPVFVGGSTGSGDLFGIGAAGLPCAINGNDELMFDHWGGGACVESEAITVPVGQWSFLCLAYDGATTVTLYANGVSMTASQAMYDYDIDTLTIGADSIGGTSLHPSFSGAIGNVGIWNAALSVSEMNEMYNSGNGCRVPPAEVWDGGTEAGATSCPSGMTYVPGGTMVLGAAYAWDNQPQTVTVASFCMDTYEVTAGQVEAAVADGGLAAETQWLPTGWQRCNYGIDGVQGQAANCIHPNFAISYCQALGKRLPTDWEWEYAARYPDGRMYPWGDTAPTASSGVCWLQDAGACSPGSSPGDVSSLGIYDLGGNVVEWATTSWQLSPSFTIEACVTSPCLATVGGGYDEDQTEMLRSGLRYVELSGQGMSEHNGFRCVSAPVPTSSPLVLEEPADAGSSPRSCEDYMLDVNGGGLVANVACNSNTADGYYWAVGAQLADGGAYGFNGLQQCGLPRCDGTAVGATAVTASWQAATEWWEVGSSYVQGGAGAKCPATNGSGGSYSCSPHCGVYVAVCTAQPGIAGPDGG